jgi:hypothetical protein
MVTLNDVCSAVRSKNAGPFWITVDLFFKDQDAWDRYAASPGLAPEVLARALDVDAATVQRFPLPDLRVMKISYPRRRAQGGPGERDMHGGQQYVRLLGLRLAPVSSSR